MTRFGYVMVTHFTVMAIGGLSLLPIAPKLIWNASASVPIGLYALHETDDPPLGALVAIKPPARLADWLAERHYLAKNVPLLKHVVAKAGQRICRIGDSVSVDLRIIGVARKRDSHGRPLPVWQGCRTLRAGQIFLMNPAVPDSLDGRYFGPVASATLLGRATPILTRDTAKGPLQWRGIRP